MKAIKWCFYFLMLVFFNSTAMARSDYGPVKSYTQSPFHTNSLSPQLRSGFSMTPESGEVTITGIISSIWAVTPDYELDYYQNQLAASGKWQLTSDWQIEVDYRWNYAGNNHLDGLTKDFHDWFSLDQNGRDNVDNNRFVIHIPDYGIELDNFRGESLSHAFTGYLQYQLLNETHHGISLGTTLYFNDTHHSIFSSSQFEQAIQINYGYRRDKHSLDTLLAITFRNTPSVFKQMPYRSNTWTVGASYRYRLSTRHHLIGQLAIHQGISGGEDEFSKPSTEFTFGYRYQMKNSAIELTAVENMFNADNSTDIAFGIGYRYQFGGSDQKT
ncbi:DUF3187 family protein [Vibrio ostreicida]|uniref:DUF3187 family protein n=1 Tax=Vibrio ostreicida TaxID=526588 RepID=A0ABT8BVP8_9VIBR|nr:DUF3187 family protein [Vibrio ostreicida]MDN3610165.1 DUF3187 family protein [Vibrio ostreicida]NPD07814.1 DUF3187 family protein [Vibrio ostreicida]